MVVSWKEEGLMGSMSRVKGKVGEREACDLLRSWFPEAARRLGQERTAADNGRDLDGTGCYCVQVKRHAKVPRHLRVMALQEAEKASKVGEIAVALWREDRGPWMVTFRAVPNDDEGHRGLIVEADAIEFWQTMAGLVG